MTSAIIISLSVSAIALMYRIVKITKKIKEINKECLAISKAYYQSLKPVLTLGKISGE